MQTGLTLTELARTIDQRARAKKDYIAQTCGLSVAVKEKDLALIIPDQGEFTIAPVAERQLTELTGVPARYFERMRLEEPELAAINANAWLKRFDGKHRRMVRTMGDRNRAMLSPKYQRIDDIDVLKVALPVLQDLPGVEVKSSNVTETNMYVQFVLPKVIGEVGKRKVGDAVQVGGVISNSEVGHGRISVSGLIYRLWCLNGAVRGDQFARSHVGREISDNEDLWSEETVKLDDRLILSRVRDMVKAVTDESRARDTLIRLNELAGAKITGSPEKVVEVLAQKIGATDEEGDAMFKALLTGSNDVIDLSAWGLVNCVTAQAHTAANYDRSVEFERLGGRLIDLPAAEWREILEAA